ncbi:hypothetical protein D3C76_166480 [compost metagenome]
MGIFKGILHFFIPRERTLVYTTFDQAEYFKIKGRLTAAGIPHRSKINGGMQALGQRAQYGGKASVQYDLYVRREDEYRAAQAMH